MYESVKNTGLEHLNNVLKIHKSKRDLLNKLYSHVDVQVFTIEEKILINAWIDNEQEWIDRTEKSIKILEESNEPKQ